MFYKFEIDKISKKFKKVKKKVIRLSFIYKVNR